MTQKTPPTPAEMDAQLQRVRFYRQQGRRADAAALAGATAIECEAELWAVNGRLSDVAARVLWRKQLAQAAIVAAEEYRDWAQSNQLQTSCFLRAAQYFNLAATVLEAGSPAQLRVISDRDQALKAFESDLAELEGDHLSKALCAQVAYRLKLFEVNREHQYLTTFDPSVKVERPEGRWINCQRVVPSVIASIQDSPTRAEQPRPRKGHYIDVYSMYEWAYGSKFVDVSTAEIKGRMLAEGDDAVGIVRTVRPGNSVEHVVVVTNENGRVLVIEGQSGAVDELGDGQDMPYENGGRYGLLVVPGLGRRATLPIDESRRAIELLALISSAEESRESADKVQAKTERIPPSSVLSAMTLLGRSPLKGVPALDDALAKARRLPVGAAVSSGIKSIRWGWPKGMEMNNAVAVKLQASYLRPGEMRIVDDGTRTAVLANLDGFIILADPRTGKVLPFRPQNVELVVINPADLPAPPPQLEAERSQSSFSSLA